MSECNALGEDGGARMKDALEKKSCGGKGTLDSGTVDHADATSDGATRKDVTEDAEKGANAQTRGGAGPGPGSGGVTAAERRARKKVSLSLETVDESAPLSPRPPARPRERRGAVDAMLSSGTAKTPSSFPALGFVAFSLLYTTAITVALPARWEVKK